MFRGATEEAMLKLLPRIRDFMKRADMLLFTLCLAASIFGIIVIRSASLTLDTPGRYVLVQTVSMFIGIALFVLLTIIDVDIIADKWAILVGFEGLFILSLLVFGEAGDTGQRAWIRFAGIGIQPAEVVKVIFIVVMAKHISFLKNYKNLNSVVSMGQLFLHCLFIVGLIVVVSEDMGSALVYIFLFVVMLFAAGVKFYWFLVGLAGVAAVFPVFWTRMLNQEYRDRILAPFLPEDALLNLGANWHATQSKLAMANGQFWGTGYMQGPVTQTPRQLFAKETDFIFAVIGEELGMIACLGVFIVLLAIILRCIYIGVRSKNTMSMLICFGVAGSLIFQTFENIGMCIGITPVIGITLPFISYGGSSMFSMFAAVGLVSGVKYKPKPERFVSYR
jgi:rod shape determining protein RodA